MEYDHPITAGRDLFRSPGPEASCGFSSRIEPEFYSEIETLIETCKSTTSSVVRDLVILGLEKLGELEDEFAEAQDDLAARLEGLGYADALINVLFSKHVDLSELNKLVVELEEKR